MTRNLRSEFGILGIIVWVWYWDSKHETITSFFWKHPRLAAFVWGWVFSHMVFGKPKRILVRW
jgi:hypothetical protein